MLSRRTTALVASAALAATMMLGVLALQAQAAIRHVDGTVLSKNSDTRSFRIATQNGNRIRVKVTASTRFERIPGGFGGLHRGLQIEVDAKKTANGLVATQVEAQGGGGSDDAGGDDHGGGADDGPNHT
jgi:hypothetical protein